MTDRSQSIREMTRHCFYVALMKYDKAARVKAALIAQNFDSQITLTGAWPEWAPHAPTHKNVV